MDSVATFRRHFEENEENEDYEDRHKPFALP